MMAVTCGQWMDLGGSYVGDGAVICAQTDEAMQGPNGEPSVADHAKAFAFDVDVGDQTPADG